VSRGSANVWVVKLIGSELSAWYSQLVVADIIILIFRALSTRLHAIDMDTLPFIFWVCDIFFSFDIVFEFQIVLCF